MHSESTIVIRRKAADVWCFLADPLNIPKWDRGVAAVEVNESTPVGVGFEFTTVGHPGSGPDRGRMTYRVTDVNLAARTCRAELISRTGNARFIRKAEWHQQVEEAPEGSRVTVSADFRLRTRYIWLGPLLFFFGKRAGDKDMTRLKNILENP